MSREFDSLDEAMGIDHSVNLPQVSVMTEEERRDVVQAEDDAEFARRNIREIIEKGKEVLEVAVDVATSTGIHSQVTAAATLISSMVTANEKLVALGKRADATKNGEGPAKVVNNTQNVTFVGTTDEILKAVRKSRGEVDNEDELQR